MKNLGVSEIVFSATHGVFSDRPKKKEKGEKSSMSLITALKRNIIDYIYVSDSLPHYKQIKDERVRFISLAKPIAALIRIAADRAVQEDYDIVRRCLYNPGPDKNLVERHFKEGNITPAYENFDMQKAVFGDRSRVIFSRKPRAN